MLKYEPFLFKLYSSFQYVNSRAEIPARAEISPCNHTGPDEFETALKFVRLQLFTRNRTNYRPKSVHTEPDEFVAEIILY